MANELKTLNDAFIDELRDAYDFEQQIVTALPAIAAAATDAGLREALEEHLTETRSQIDRLVRVFEMVDERPAGKPCAGMAGILEEGQDILDDQSFDPETKDACLIAGCQRVEHYEIAVYGTLVAWAQTLGLDDAATLLQESLEEEEAADALLSDLAETDINVEALEG